MIMIMIRNLVNDDGQISLDYVIGVSIFVVSFFFLYNILTSLFLPFQSNSNENKPMADRASMVLIESTSGLAVSESSPNIIDKTKIVQLGADLNNPLTYDGTRAKLGLVTSNLKYNLNISLRYFNNSLYPNSSYPILMAGSTPDEYTNVAQTMRVVYLSQDSKRLMLVVKVWL